ncbi:MAG TPA: helix-turn-helix domain-containing protein [Firmicutes bacterium]|nr:helix-turn-helix domain-containing protein [Bacillota bacterium]
MFIGQRLKLARQAVGLSLRDLAEKVQLSAQALSKYERGLDVPSSGVLLRLARALGVKTEYFFRPDLQLEITPVFRKRSTLGKRQEAAIVSRIREWLERYLELEGLFPPEQAACFALPDGLDNHVTTMEGVERLAEQLRGAWGLGLDPIENFMEMLEDRGIKVGLVDGCPDFDACTFWAGECPILVVRSDMPGDRQRFNLAHELGHLVLVLDGILNAEVAAHRFAGAFLVPASAARRELGEHRRRITVSELHLLKHKYGLSMQGWIYRAKDLQIISESTAVCLFREFRTQGWHVKEPGSQVPPEEPKRMAQLVLRAYAEGLVSESRAAELLGVPLGEFLVASHGGRAGAPEGLRD